MKLTEQKLKELILEEIEALGEGYVSIPETPKLKEMVIDKIEEYTQKGNMKPRERTNKLFADREFHTLVTRLMNDIIMNRNKGGN